MPEVVSNGEEGGNTSVPPSSKQRPNARMHWFFTFNNYGADDIVILNKVFTELCYMFAFQEEQGEETGTKHLQGIISLKKRARWTEFGLQKAIHWEKPKNVKDCYIYCTKEETRCGEVFTLNYTLPYTFRLEEEQLYSWQRDLLDLVKQTPDDRKVNWIWSAFGRTGKSTFVKHLVMNHNAILLTKGTYSDMCNVIYKADMMKSRIVIFDLPRNNGSKISYSAVESIKNGMICNTKYETGFKCFPPPHLIIFANEEPDQEALSWDRWNIKEIT